ncbi:MAG: ATP-binding cassette domain-containing protein, partial [Bacteroidetes bacterium]|nr:ATP-binding cassette domain-containing protein [Bacteroidota bacterium]
MSIVVDNIVKTYGKQIAVDHLSFEVNKGEVVGFLGPNGAGKTSTMKMICGYLQADSGNIKVCNEAVSPESTHFRQNIGYLPENNPLYLEMYIKEYLHFVAKCYNVGKNAPQMIQTAMERTGLLPEQHKKIQQLSK